MMIIIIIEKKGPTYIKRSGIMDQGKTSAHPAHAQLNRNKRVHTINKKTAYDHTKRDNIH